MMQNTTWMLNRQVRAGDNQSAVNDPAIRIAAVRFREAQLRALLGQIRAFLSGRAHRLLHLGTVQAAARVRSGRYAGVRSVPISRIRGSEGRAEDFDADFRPLKVHNRWRWLSVAAAYQKGIVLPPVELIQVGDVYFVRDGHHRISVARAFGQEQIDAEVTVWEVAGPPPWEPQVGAGQVAYQPA